MSEEILLMNSNRLTTIDDVVSTIENFVSNDPNAPTKSSGTAASEVISLFRQAPVERTCVQAGLSVQQCPCLKMINNNREVQLSFEEEEEVKVNIGNLFRRSSLLFVSSFDCRLRTVHLVNVTVWTHRGQIQIGDVVRSEYVEVTFQLFPSEVVGWVRFRRDKVENGLHLLLNTRPLILNDDLNCILQL